MELWSDDEIRTILLMDYYRIRHIGRDRRGDTPLNAAGDAHNLNVATGLPESASDLLPRHRATVGTELALKCPLIPGRWAEAHLDLAFKPKDQWTDAEVWEHSELTMRLKRVVNRLATENLFIETPEDPYYGDGRPIARGSDGLTIFAQITWKGLEEAERLAETDAGRSLKRGPASILADAPPEVLAQAPHWARKAYEDERERQS